MSPTDGDDPLANLRRSCARCKEGEPPGFWGARQGDSGEAPVSPTPGEDVHAVGSLAPLADAIGCIVIRPDGSRELARLVPDPLAQRKPD
jgi:hypothetical protein